MYAGRLRERFCFEERATLNEPGDGAGTITERWLPRCTAWASLKLLRVGEDVLASRLTGVKPGILTVRASRETRDIRTEWRAINRITGETYNIRSVEPSADRSMIEMLVSAGVADG